MVVGEDIIMDLGNIILDGALVHLGKGPGRTADADEGYVDIVDPFDIIELFLDIFDTVFQAAFVRVPCQVELFRERHGAHGNGNRMD